MAGRRDALVAAAKVVVIGVREIATSLGGGTVATVGQLDVEPNALNVIPGTGSADRRPAEPRRDQAGRRVTPSGSTRLVIGSAVGASTAS